MITIHIDSNSSPKEREMAQAVLSLMAGGATKPSTPPPPVEPIHPPPPVISPAEAPASSPVPEPGTDSVAPAKRGPGRPPKKATPVVEETTAPVPAAETNAELEALLAEYAGVLREGGVSEEKITIALQPHRENVDLDELRKGIEESKEIVAKRKGAAPVQEKTYSPEELRAALNELNEREGFEVALAFLQNDMNCRNIAALASRPAADHARFMARCAGKGE